MLLTKELLDDIIQDSNKEINSLGLEKSRKNKNLPMCLQWRNKTYTSNEREILIMDMYIIFICQLCQKLIKGKEYTAGRVATHLRTFDWNHFSLSGKAWCADDVRILLDEKKSVPSWEILSYQSYRLKKAADHVADMLEADE